MARPVSLSKPSTRATGAPIMEVEASSTSPPECCLDRDPTFTQLRTSHSWAFPAWVYGVERPHTFFRHGSLCPVPLLNVPVRRRGGRQIAKALNTDVWSAESCDPRADLDVEEKEMGEHK